MEQKSSADEREAYKGTTSEETAIEKEHKKEEIRRISTSEFKKYKKLERRCLFLTPSLFFGYAQRKQPILKIHKVGIMSREAKPLEGGYGCHILIGKGKVEYVGILHHTGGCYGLGQGERTALEAPSDAYLRR